MLISLMPTAFAVSRNSKDVEASMDSDDYLSLSFLDRNIPYSNYYIDDITGDSDNDRYEPDVVDDDDDDWDEYNEYIDDEDLSDFYFLSYEDSSGKYEYTIKVISEDDETEDEKFYIYLTLYVDDDGSGSSGDGDIYAEIDKNGYVDLYDIEEELYDFGWDELKGTPDSIKFTGWGNGELYDEENDVVSKRTLFDLETEDQDSDLEYYGIYFEIDDDDEEAYIDFTIYDDGSDSVSGTIVINGDGTSTSGDIEYEAEYNTSVTFDADDFEDLVPNGYELDEVSFTLPAASKGTLYTTSAERTKVTARDTFDSDELDEVTFAPKTGVTGSVSISFTMECYKSRTNTKTVRGTVVISIADGTTITYTGEVDEEVEFDEDDFIDVCEEVTGRDLDYVKFSLPTSSKGTLYAEYNGTSRGSTTAKSSDKFYTEPGKNEYDLDDVVFVPKTSGTVELTYTAYPTRGSSFTGKVKITTTAGALKDISYTVGSKGSVTFSASDFTSALRGQTSRGLSYVKFTLPKSSEGTLYYNGTTKVSASTQYKATGSTNSLSKVSFTPASVVSGNVTIRYTAVDTSGNTYNGSVVIKTFLGQDTVISYSTTGTAVSFKTSDFTNACSKKLGTTLSYVQFSLPKSTEGTLYYGWGTSQQTRVTANTKYTAATYLPYVSFVPKTGFSGTANVVYTGYDTAGSFYIGSIQVTVTTPTRSINFTDANQAWIAPSADFLQANGVYSGVVSGTTLGVGTSVTRGEVMQMIYNAFGLKNKVTSVTSNFTDVPANSAYYTAINAAYKLGIAQGYDGKFRPNEAITRQDACTLLYRAFQTLGLNMTTGTANDLNTFGDAAKVDSYAVNGVAGMVKSGIIGGDQNHNISPKNNLTRGEISVILHRAMTL